jgi:multicomponent Na+:H+ antiporter subunit E
MILWLVMSGVYTPLVIGLGAAASLFVTYLIIRMDRVDEGHPDFRLAPLRYIRYFIWLLGEIARANWAVTKIVLGRKPPVHQHLFYVPATQATEVAQVTFANSITLTPGTITVETEPGRFLVHALNYSEADRAALADMDARISAVETRSAREGVS